MNRLRQIQASTSFVLLLQLAPTFAYTSSIRSGFHTVNGFSLRNKYGFNNQTPTTITTNHKSSFTLKASSSNTSEESTIFERVLQNPKWPPEWPFSSADFARNDESDDSLFYESPRLVYHIDDFAVSALTKYYEENLSDGADVLDICSSWVSHYPKDWKGGNVVGLGMNEYELSQNKQLTSYNVKDLNKDPTFPYEDESFDAVTCVVSVDYLNKPQQVFQEIGRVLRPGGVCMLSMSNRCFPTKAFQIWLQTNDLEHVFIAGAFFHYSGLFEPPKCDDISPNPGRSDPLFIVRANKK